MGRAQACLGSRIFGAGTPSTISIIFEMSKEHIKYYTSVDSKEKHGLIRTFQIQKKKIQTKVDW